MKFSKCLEYFFSENLKKILGFTRKVILGSGYIIHGFFYLAWHALACFFYSNVVTSNRSGREKSLFGCTRTTKGTDQPVHPCSVVSVFSLSVLILVQTVCKCFQSTKVELARKDLITVPIFFKKTYYGQVYVMSEHQICGSGCIFTRSDPCRNSSLMLINGVLALNSLTSVIERVCFASSVWIHHWHMHIMSGFLSTWLELLKNIIISTH